MQCIKVTYLLTLAHVTDNHWSWRQVSRRANAC